MRLRSSLSVLVLASVCVLAACAKRTAGTPELEPQRSALVGDNQPLVRAAERAQLDRLPAVRAQLAAARDSVLASAYVSWALQQQAVPSDAAIGAYYRSHPELFAHRRLYLMRELNVDLAPARFGELQRHAEGAHDLLQLEQWLQSAHIKFDAANSARGSDELPHEVLPAFLRLRNGDIGVARSARGAWVLQVIHSVSAPLTLTQARASIIRTLLQRTLDAPATAPTQASSAKLSPPGLVQTSLQADAQRPAVAVATDRLPLP